MIKRTQHSLKFITKQKESHLSKLFDEYTIVVNKFIQIYWNQTKFPNKPASTEWRQVQTWLCGKAVKCAYRQAIQIIKSTKDKNKKLIYKAYKKCFKYAKDKKKNWDIVKLKWTDYIKDKNFRNRVTTPVFNGNSIDLNSDLCKIYTSTNMKEFDLAVRLGSIWGNRLSILLPTKKHEQFNKHIKNGFELNSSIQLRRINGKFYINLFLEKEAEKIKDTGEALGIDLGIKKMISTSTGKFFGKDIEKKIKKIKSKTRGSKNHKDAIKELKDYIGQEVNKIDISNVNVIVVEDLKVSNMSKKGKSSKEFRKTLGNWNSRLLFGRLSNRCEENRVLLAKVESEYTSQKCSSCGEIHKESRKGERYECVVCGMVLDADYNASLNILNRFLNRESTVTYEQKNPEVLLTSV